MRARRSTHLNHTSGKPVSGSSAPRILVAGLGNLLLRDDGVGCHAVKQFEGTQSVRTLEVGCALFDALTAFEWAERILFIDAMKAGGAPGTIYRVGMDDIDGGGIPASLHELSVVHALRIIDKTPRPVMVLIGVEPEVIDYGLKLSPPVQKALPRVLEAGKEIVMEWIRECFAGDALAESQRTGIECTAPHDGPQHTILGQV